MNIHDKDRNILVDEILSNYKSKLDDLTMSELEEELEAEESTTKFGEIPYSHNTSSSQDDRELRPWGENHERTLNDSRRQESRGEIEEEKKRRSLNDQRMMAKWEKHQEYSKQTSREDLRQEPRRQSEK